MLPVLLSEGSQRRLFTYYSLFVIDLASRRVHLAGPTRHPDDAFMRQVARDLTAPIVGFLGGHRVLICDRDRKWSDGFQQLFEPASAILDEPRQRRRI